MLFNNLDFVIEVTPGFLARNWVGNPFYLSDSTNSLCFDESYIDCIDFEVLKDAKGVRPGDTRSTIIECRGEEKKPNYFAVGEASQVFWVGAETNNSVVTLWRHALKKCFSTLSDIEPEEGMHIDDWLRHQPRILYHEATHVRWNGDCKHSTSERRKHADSVKQLT
jgi:hypothetical protein